MRVDMLLRVPVQNTFPNLLERSMFKSSLAKLLDKSLQFYLKCPPKNMYIISLSHRSKQTKEL